MFNAEFVNNFNLRINSNADKEIKMEDGAKKNVSKSNAMIGNGKCKVCGVRLYITDHLF
jgi:hypothetical protein